MRVFVSSPPDGLNWQLRHSTLVAAFRGAGCEVSEAVPRRGTFPLERRAKNVDVAVVFASQVAPSSARLVVRDIADADQVTGASDVIVCADEATAARVGSETATVVVPTAVDCDMFAPPLRPRAGDALPRLGWILGTEGSEAVLPGDEGTALRALRALLGRLGHHVRYALDVSGAGMRIRVPGVMVRHRPAPALDTLPEILLSVDALLVTPGPDATAAALLAAAAGVVPVAFDVGGRVRGALPGSGQEDHPGERAADDDEFVRLMGKLLRDPEFRAERSVRARAWVVAARRQNAIAREVGAELVVLATA